MTMPVKSPTQTLEDSEIHSLRKDFFRIRKATESFCKDLEIEDYVVQSIPEASPVKWHLAHTSWFFETFILSPHLPGYRSCSPKYRNFFNSYYQAVGSTISQDQRGSFSRPTVKDIYAYRNHVDMSMETFFQDAGRTKRLKDLTALGLSHEQQHQELILTDLKHAFASNPLRPVYRPGRPPHDESRPPHQWIPYPGGTISIGTSGPAFAFDNECPSHKIFLEPYQLASRLVTVGEYLAFMEDGGYLKPDLWFSDGWKLIQERGWKSPLYMEMKEGQWWVMTLSGFRKVCEAEPVCHINYYEADAYARWAGFRLPTEQEWECAASGLSIQGNFVEEQSYHPLARDNREPPDSPSQMFGDVWEWTSSPYAPYPGYSPPHGALGEYNGKFMCNKMVLRGGSCVTPRSHIRPTYRNYWAPDCRWQFTGIRLAKNVR